MGSVEFRIKYRAIVLKPFKNEVVDAVVVTVNKMGFFAEVGPLNIFISNHVLPTFLLSFMYFISFYWYFS